MKKLNNEQIEFFNTSMWNTLMTFQIFHSTGSMELYKKVVKEETLTEEELKIVKEAANKINQFNQQQTKAQNEEHLQLS